MASGTWRTWNIECRSAVVHGVWDIACMGHGVSHPLISLGIRYKCMDCEVKSQEEMATIHSYQDTWLPSLNNF